MYSKSQYSSVSVVTERRVWRPGFDFRQANGSSLLRFIHTDPVVHQVSYTGSTCGPFSWHKSAGKWSWPLCRVPRLRICGAVSPLSYVFMGCAYKLRDKYPFIFQCIFWFRYVIFQWIYSCTIYMFELHYLINYIVYVITRNCEKDQLNKYFILK
jgi:hypothetical protein